jgi:hypothetical protein
MAAQLVRQPTPPDAMLGNLPPGLSILVMRCLQKDPEHRYQDAAALIQDLRRISDGEGGRVSRGVGTHLPPTLPAATRRPGTIAMVTGVAAAALAIGYVLASGRDPVTPVAPFIEPSAAAISPASLTAADSLAIAAAVERAVSQQSAEAETTTRAMLDSLRREITATVTDSIRRASRDAPRGRSGSSVELSEGVERRQQMDELLSFAGRAADGPNLRGTASAPRLGSDPASRVMIVPGTPVPGSGWFSLNQRALVEQVGAALGNGFPVEVVSATGRTDSLLARGVAPEAVARLTNARFYMTLAPSRQRDSLGVTVLIHDLSPGSRQVRTVRVPLESRALSSGALAESLAARIASTVEEMQGLFSAVFFGKPYQRFGRLARGLVRNSSKPGNPL